jgi:fatty acid amide hydrolase
MSVASREALLRMPAGELAKAVKRGEVPAVEAVEAHIARIEEVNGALNAVIVKRYDQARAEAREIDDRRARGETLGPLAGVPITVKESLDLAGTPSTFGIPSRKAALAERDDLYVARMREAGAIVLGKTNVAQVLMYIESDNPLYGRSKNPWNLDRATGGSSGGQAAILAAGGTPLGIGTDIGGSLRFPAAFCGIASIKPTAGRTPDAGRFSVHIGQQAILSQVGPMAREVDDLALGLKVISGDADPIVEPAVPLGDPASVDIASLRVAYYTDDGTISVAPSIRRAVTEAAGILAGRGATVTEWRPPDVPHALDLWIGIIAADGTQYFSRILKGNKKHPSIATHMLLAHRSRATLAVLRGLLRATGQRGTADLIRNFGRRDTLHYWQLVEQQMAYQQRFLHALDSDEGGPFDVIICPVAAVPAIPHGTARYLASAGGYNPLYNVLGYPAGVVPVSRVRPGEESARKGSLDLVQRTARKAEQGSAGLPLGVQVVARPWREHVALAAMRAIQEVARTHEDYPNEPKLAALARSS